MTPEIEALAARFFGAVAAGDIETAGACYADDVTVWSTLWADPQTKAENLKMLAWVARRLQGMRYEDVVWRPLPNGFVQRHVLRGAVGEQEIDAPACIVVEVRGGVMTRLFEYMDSARLRPLLARNG